MRSTLPTPSVNPSPLACVRVRARHTVMAALVMAAAALLAPSGAVAAPASTIPSQGERWFGIGANVPFIEYGCDFGCGKGRGLRGTRARADVMLRTMSRRGVRVVRWYLFPGDAWQVRRGADGTPTSVASGALHDFDVAVDLAEKHDVYLLPVVLPEPTKVPATWFTDVEQAQALATALRPLYARHRSNRHVLGWELVSGAEALLDSGTATREQLRAHASRMRLALRAAAPGRLAVFGALDVSRLDTWVDLGANAYTAQDVTASAGETCGLCRSVGALVDAEGVDAPVMIGGFAASTTTSAFAALRGYDRRGYAGALAWSWRGARHPQLPGERIRIQDDALWRYHYAHGSTGPRSRPLNPCAGPSARVYRCPNLRMSVPSNLSLGRRGGRSILYSTNSLDSRGAGPASLHGRRNGRFTMAASQVLHRVDGRTTQIDTGGKLLFKAIPGQYRYWKWNGAARMELWRLDSTGAPVERTRIGPKTVYCLRDLKRTLGSLPRSPRGMVYPGCSQNLSQRSVTLGTSVGWSDVYPASYYENWIDVTGLRGCFAYVHVADPTNVIYESNEDDNASKVVVRLPFTGSNRGCPGAKPLPAIGDGGLGTY